jgi:hypothetical protein
MDEGFVQVEHEALALRVLGADRRQQRILCQQRPGGLHTQIA